MSCSSHAMETSKSYRTCHCAACAAAHSPVSCGGGQWAQQQEQSSGSKSPLRGGAHTAGWVSTTVAKGPACHSWVGSEQLLTSHCICRAAQCDGLPRSSYLFGRSGWRALKEGGGGAACSSGSMREGRGTHSDVTCVLSMRMGCIGGPGSGPQLRTTFVLSVVSCSTQQLDTV